MEPARRQRSTPGPSLFTSRWPSGEIQFRRRDFYLSRPLRESSEEALAHRVPGWAADPCSMDVPWRGCAIDGTKDLEQCVDGRAVSLRRHGLQPTVPFGPRLRKLNRGHSNEAFDSDRLVHRIDDALHGGMHHDVERSVSARHAIGDDEGAMSTTGRHGGSGSQRHDREDRCRLCNPDAKLTIPCGAVGGRRVPQAAVRGHRP